MKSTARKSSRARGFTLIELVVTLVVIAVTAAVALPSFTGLIRSNRVTSQTNELMASLALARTEAIRSNSPVVGNRDVVLCPSSNGTTCSADWSDGWIVARRVDDAIVTVLRHTQQPTGMAIASAEEEIVFDNRGRRRDGPGQISLQPDNCGAGEPYLRTLMINASGQVRIVQQACP